MYLVLHTTLQIPLLCPRNNPMEYSIQLQSHHYSSNYTQLLEFEVNLSLSPHLLIPHLKLVLCRYDLNLRKVTRSWPLGSSLVLPPKPKIHHWLGSTPTFPHPLRRRIALTLPSSHSSTQLVGPYRDKIRNSSHQQAQ